MTSPLNIPLSGWADDQLNAIAALAESREIAALSGAKLLAERAMLGGYKIPGRVSAGGGCRLFEARKGHIALNLSRREDRNSMPALFGDASVNGDDDEAVAERVLRHEAMALIRRGRELGLAIAAMDECRAKGLARSCLGGSPANERVQSQAKLLPKNRPPLVIDLSALWAGPLASRLLHMAGAQVIKIESRNRPDAMRDGNPAFFARLNQGKEHIALDLRDATDHNTLIMLIRRAQIVIEAARPRALLQLGIDADALVREVPGLVWASITAHGVAGEAANWVGFGDDCGVAGGLSAALFETTGAVGFVGDAIADPLTGIFAARKITEQCTAGRGARLVLSMSDVVADALSAERTRDEAALNHSLAQWASSERQAFPSC